MLYQGGVEVLRADFGNAVALDALLARFVSYEPREVTEFHRAVEPFNADVPALVTELRAQLPLLAPGAEVEAESALRQAVAFAQDYGPRWFELRAMTGLARLLHRLGRSDEGRAPLTTLCGTFTKGGHQRNLVEARLCLEAAG